MLIGMKWIHLNQLLSLGLTEDQLYFIIILCGMFVSYYIVQPIVHWFVAINSTKVLSYLIASLLVMIGILLFSIQQMNGVFANLLKIGFQSLAVFGCILFIVRLGGAIHNKVKKRSV